ncbi:hypothetical protein HALDL1_16475 [Halobacterium sp. DL1]|jgi:enamine deaminase RidA (YjgF/YER057c/UK114 family)|nr:hypothetical protein HALDL1_16475 [Halobacterium sp. DL1]
MRQLVSSGNDWEDRVGYSRAVRAGDQVHVSGTTAVEDGEVVAPGDPYEQTKHAIDIVADALREADASLSDVVRTRLFLTDVDDWEAVGRAHEEAFGGVRPATTVVEVSRLLDDDLVVEVEATAVCE